MERLIYTSTAIGNLAVGDIQAIVAQSERNNAETGIGGFLIYAHDRFLQMLEGPALLIEALMKRIDADPRHDSLEIVLRETAKKAWFPDWDMKPLISFSGTPGLEELREELAVKDPEGRVMAEIRSFLAA